MRTTVEGATPRQVHLEQGTKQWLAWRREGPAASEMSALFTNDDGSPVSPYNTMRDLFFEKSGFVDLEDEDADKRYIYQKGHETEAEIRKLFSKHTQIQLQPTCFEYGIFRCSLDGYDKRVGILEAKLVGKEVLKKIAVGEIPLFHRIQVQTQLFCSDSDKAYYGARAPKVKDGEVVEIGRDEKLIKEIKQRGEQFWEMVLAGKAPPLSPRDTLFLTDPKQIEIFEKLKVLKAQRDSINQVYEELEKCAKSFAVHPKVRCGDVTITEVERSGSIDFMKVPEVQGLSEEYLEMFRKKSSVYKMIKVGKGA